MKLAPRKILMDGSTVIQAFHHEYAFLSNFHPAVVTFEGDRYPTVEHAFQAAKTTDAKQRAQIRAAATAALAKRLGRYVSLRASWEYVKLGVMHELLLCKFQDKALKRKLVDTFPAYIIEGNSWGDNFWGVDDDILSHAVGARGQNWLGILLMLVRSEVA